MSCLQLALKEVDARNKARRGVTLPWLMKVCKNRLRTLAAAGQEVMYRGEPFRGSKTWLWKFLAQNGYVSEGCQRADHTFVRNK